MFVMGNVQQSVHHFGLDGNVSLLDGLPYIVFSLCGTQRINPDDSREHLTFLIELQCI